MPSLHAAYAVGVGIGLVRFGRVVDARRGRDLPAGRRLTIVVTGNHFFLDAVAGVLVLGVGFLLLAAPRQLTVVYCAPRRGVEQSGSSPGS